MDLTGAGPASAEFIHRVTEAMKLAFADREAYYGDPAFVDVPLERLLSEDYNAARRRLIGEQASHELSPGRLAGFEAQVDRVMDTLRRLSSHGAWRGAGCHGAGGRPRRRVAATPPTLT